ncbi:MAG: DUF2628 domain-containing protein [Methylobacteriaceae bacterium]|nr:DUF2628 domain-containing protein [Methylobacteriaceae bacterium]
MKTYTVHVAAGAAGDEAALEKARVIADGFRWGAFLFGFLWFIAKGYIRLGLLVLLAAELLPAGLMMLIGMPPPYSPAILVVIHLLLGLEADSLMRAACERARLPQVGVVLAANAGEAERRGFSDWLERREPHTAPADNDAPAVSAAVDALPLQETGDSNSAEQPEPKPLFTGDHS